FFSKQKPQHDFLLCLNLIFFFSQSNIPRHTYWDREEQTNYNIMLSHYFNMGSIRNMSVSLTGYRYEYDNRADKGMYI
ncbi:fimbria/pilus outer membrane usher protein, partial [Micromonospora arborensis]|uniref:fimbria/pilus outer membrane usher protein n=1 Tax=Micromonospora arborensis TaxID=2116518 RepID=UPI001FC97CFE